MIAPPHHYHASSCVLDQWDAIRRRRTQLLSSSEKLPTLCCSEIATGAGCQSPRGCLSRRTFAEAEATCHSAGLRLCAKEELQTGMCCFDGCNLSEEEPVWSSTPATKYEIKHYAASCILDRPNGTHRREGSQLLSPVNDKANVLCCNNTEGKCGQGCLSKRSFAQGKAACQSAGLRLCTKRELESGACCGDGYCEHSVWSSTTQVIACCSRKEAECLACEEGVSIEKYCGLVNAIDVPGCQGDNVDKVDKPNDRAMPSTFSIIPIITFCIIPTVCAVTLYPVFAFRHRISWCHGLYSRPGVPAHQHTETTDAKELIRFSSRDVT